MEETIARGMEQTLGYGPTKMAAPSARAPARDFACWLVEQHDVRPLSSDDDFRVDSNVGRTKRSYRLSVVSSSIQSPNDSKSVHGRSPP